MFIQTSGPLAACLLNDHVLKKKIIIIIIIIMAGMAVFNVAGYLIEERRRWPVEKKKLFVENLGPPGARGPGARAPMAPLLIRHWMY